MSINNLERFLAKINSNQLAIGAVITFSDPAVSELCADAGMDFLWIDGEHGVMDRTTAQLHMMAIRGTSCASFYRVPACNHTEIKRIIDFAPAGIIIPMIMNEKDAADAVSFCRYPTEGTRGCGLRRQHRYGADPVNAEYFEQAKKEPLVILQIEHIEAVRNLDKILQVPGIDALLIGPYDLSASMGIPGQFQNPDFCAAVDQVCQKCHAAHKILGCYAESNFDLWKKRGVQFIAAAGDTGLLFQGIRQMRHSVEEAFKN